MLAVTVTDPKTSAGNFPLNVYLLVGSNLSPNSYEPAAIIGSVAAPVHSCTPLPGIPDVSVHLIVTVCVMLVPTCRITAGIVNDETAGEIVPLNDVLIVTLIGSVAVAGSGRIEPDGSSNVPIKPSALCACAEASELPPPPHAAKEAATIRPAKTLLIRTVSPCDYNRP